MAQKNVILLLIGVLLLGAFANLMAQNTILKDLQKQGFSTPGKLDSTSNVKSLNDLNNWFTCRQMELYRENLAKVYGVGSPDVLIPIGVYPIKKQISLKARWEMNINYVTHLQTTNVGIGYYRELSDKWFVTPYASFGGGSSNVAKIKTPIDFNIGVGADVGRYLSNRFAFVLGGLYSWVDPKSPATGFIQTGTGISIYAGGKYFFARNNQFSFNLKAGQQFWSGFASSAGSIMPPNFYAQAGLSIYRSASMAKIYDNKWRPLELGLFYCPNLRAGYIKVLQPYAIREELSIAPFISYGQEISNKCPSLTSLIRSDMIYNAAAGFEIRLFGKNLEKYVNPYIGANLIRAEYHQTAPTDKVTIGTGWSAYIGTRVKILGNLAFDANVGRAFWDKKGFPEPPGDMIVNSGLVFALGKKSKTEELNLHGKVLTKKIEAGDPFPPMTACNPLTEKMLDEYDGEIRTFAYREAETTIFGNLTDLSFIEYFGTGFKYQDVEKFDGSVRKLLKILVNETLKQSHKNVVVMLNKDQINIDKLKRAELYLCFTNYNRNRYFGYYYDELGELQPEHLKSYSLGDAVTERSNPHNTYMGDFETYTAKLDWVDNYREPSGIITPHDVKTKVLEKFMSYNGLDAEDNSLKQKLLGKYEFAYAVCDISLFEKMEKFLNDDELGYAVLAGKDFNNNKTLFIKKDDGSITFDPSDDYVYSNHERADKYDQSKVDPPSDMKGGKIRLENFGECEIDLTIEQIKLLVDNRNILTSAKQIKVVGYADGSAPTPDCLSIFKGGNPEIALERALSVKLFLHDIFEIDDSKIEAMIGNIDPSEPKCPTCRRVDIEIEPGEMAQ